MSICISLVRLYSVHALRLRCPHRTGIGAPFAFRSPASALVMVPMAVREGQCRSVLSAPVMVCTLLASSCERLSLLLIYIICVGAILIVYVIIIIFYYDVICVNCDVVECVNAQHKYNKTLYNLIIRKYKWFVPRVCIVIL